MKENILRFPPHLTSRLQASRPIHVAPNTTFLRLDVADDTYGHMGFFEGAVFIAQANKVVDGHLHYIEIDGYGFLARITRSSQSTVQVAPLNHEISAGTYPRGKLACIGIILEIYPRGMEEAHTCGLTATLCALLEAEARLAAFRKDVGMMRWQSDEHGYFIISEEIRAWLSLAGCEPDVWAGWGWIDFLHPEDKDAFLFRWSAAIETGKPYLNQGRVCISGVWLYMVVSANPIRNASGKIVKWEGFLHLEAIETRLSA